jgi:hypothetical protein
VSAVATALRELWGLFVEDPSLTLGILGCLLIAAFAFPALRLRDEWRGPLLFVLLAIVLWENVRRSATTTRSLDHVNHPTLTRTVGTADTSSAPPASSPRSPTG